VESLAPLQIAVRYLVGGLSIARLQLIQSLVFFFANGRVCAAHGLVPPHPGHKVPSCLKVMTHEIPPPLRVDPSRVNRARALDVADHLRHRVFRGLVIIMCAW
jgi:hypothetical protein